MTKQVDILGFDAVAESEAGVILSMKNTDGTDTGIKFKVLGRHSDVVQTWSKKLWQKAQRDAEMAKKRGKDVEPVDIDELKEKALESAVLRVTGWVNVKQEFSNELLKQVLQKNPHFADQVVEASNNDALFTKAS